MLIRSELDVCHADYDRPRQAPVNQPCSGDEPEHGNSVSYRRAYELTFLIQGWSQSERRRPGSATSRFQASQQASTMAR